jgi:MscS family membrane protein
MPTDPDHVDEDGQHRIQPLPDLPDLVLERGADGAWRYTRATLEQVPRLYQETFSPLSLWFQRQLPDAFYTRVLGLYAWQALYALMLLTGAVLVGRAAHWLLGTWARRVLRGGGLALDERTFARLVGPITVLAGAVVFLWGIPDLQLSIGLSWALYGAMWLIVGLAGIVVAARAVDVAAGIARARAAQTESRMDDQVIPLLRQAGRLLVFVVGMLFILQNYGVDVVSLVAGLGLGGLAFALAAQDTVANLFGSLNIFLDKPFQIGDWVIIGKVEGTVEEVGFRSTRIRTFYNSVVTVPNSSITTTNVDNMGARHRRRVKTVLGLTYDTPPDKVQAFVEGVRAILAAHPEVEKTYEVHFNGFGASSLEILVYYHVVVPSWTAELEAKAENYLEFLRLARALGVSFAFPSTSLYVESTPEHPLAPRPSESLEQLAEVAAAFGPGGRASRPHGPAFGRSFAARSVADRGA